MNEAIKRKFQELVPGRVSYRAELARMTTYGLGGAAQVFVEPDTLTELAGLMEFIRENNLPWFLLGGGSNVLFMDQGFSGVVIRLGPEFAKLKMVEAGEGRVLLEAGAAARTAELVAIGRREGLSGLEFMAGIPGRIGGALHMNAGAQGWDISSRLVRMETLNAAGRLEEFSRERLNPDYRDMNLPPGTIILSGVFELARSQPEEVDAKVREILEKRRRGYPHGVKSAGSVFRNPPGDYAGRLIDAAGLKGATSGEAWVAEEHGNFIVHRGRASAEDILKLIGLVQAGVKEKFNVDLETEIQIIGPEGLERR